MGFPKKRPRFAPQLLNQNHFKMKKVFAVLALVGVMTSCNNKKKDEKKPEGDTTAVVTPPADNTTPPADNSGAIPTFADADVQKYVTDYTAFVQSYLDAYKAKDMTKVQELATKMTEWSGKSTEIGQKLATNPEEAKKFADYMTKLSTDWANAAKSMMPEVK